MINRDLPGVPVSDPGDADRLLGLSELRRRGVFAMSNDGTERERGRLHTIDPRILAYVTALAMVSWYWYGPELAGFIIGTGILLLGYVGTGTERGESR